MQFLTFVFTSVAFAQDIKAGQPCGGKTAVTNAEGGCASSLKCMATATGGVAKENKASADKEKLTAAQKQAAAEKLAAEKKKRLDAESNENPGNGGGGAAAAASTNPKKVTAAEKEKQAAAEKERLAAEKERLAAEEKSGDVVRRRILAEAPATKTETCLDAQKLCKGTQDEVKCKENMKCTCSGTTVISVTVAFVVAAFSLL